MQRNVCNVLHVNYGGSHGYCAGRGRGGAEAEDQVIELRLGVFQVPGGDDRGGMLDHLHRPDDVVAGGVIDGPDEGLPEAMCADSRRIDAALEAGLHQDSVGLGAVERPVAAFPGFEEEFCGSWDVVQRSYVILDRSPRLFVQDHPSAPNTAFLLSGSTLEERPGDRYLARHIPHRGQDLADCPGQELCYAVPDLGTGPDEQGIPVAMGGKEVGFDAGQFSGSEGASGHAPRWVPPSTGCSTHRINRLIVTLWIRQRI